MRSDAVMGCTL